PIRQLTHWYAHKWIQAARSKADCNVVNRTDLADQEWRSALTHYVTAFDPDALARIGEWIPLVGRAEVEHLLVATVRNQRLGTSEVIGVGAQSPVALDVRAQ